MSAEDGPAKRALRMAAMSASITGSYLGYLAQSAFLGEEQKKVKLKAAHTRAGRRMRDEMTQLRGPAMKLGQALSLQSELLPEETLVELSRLQMQAPGMHPSLVRAQFIASMKRDPESVFEEFDPTPFAAASLGQVHHARADGKRVAVKIQYPGIRAAIENDFKWFRAVSKPARLASVMPSEAIDELEEQILAECDYRREAENVEFFRKRLAAFDWLEIPRVDAARSTDKVLTMSLVKGMHLDDFLATRPSRAVRDLVGKRLFELFYFQLLRMHALHADPNWGNYLFRPDGSIGLVDFGCVKYFARKFVDNIQRLFLYKGDRDSAEFRSVIAERYAGRRATLTPATFRAYASMSKNFYGRVYPPDDASDDTPFDFSDEGLMKSYLSETSRIAKARGGIPEYVMLARAETGLYQTLHRLQARVHTSRIVRGYLRPR